MEHSKEPWGIGAMESGQAAIDSADGKEVTGFIGMEDARRILACVNACAGLDTALLENITMLGDTLKDRIDVLRSEANERDELQSQLATERASLFAENQRKQQLEQQVAELVQALEFYADKQRYMGSNQRVEAPDIYGESPSNTVYLWDVMKDGGDIARAVIQKVRGGEC